MSCLVTGVAGFIGSQLAEDLFERGHTVIGVDCFTSYYSKSAKLQNLSKLIPKDGFTFIEADIAKANLSPMLEGVDYVFHLAGQPGVRPSWGESFSHYVNDNMVATQRLLEVSKKKKLKKFIFASSSSIYGDSERLPTPETITPNPVSPYGASKLFTESICHVYHRNFGLPTVGLRYFTVYGPKQRPDMAFNIFARKISEGLPLEIYGDGMQSRDFTYVKDTIGATILCMEGKPGSIFNVGTGIPSSIIDVISIIESIIGEKANTVYQERALGDVMRTCADISKIESELGYHPTVKLNEGLQEQITWQLGSVRAADATLRDELAV